MTLIVQKFGGTSVGSIDRIKNVAARALATNPELLLLDEITAALDPELVGEVLDVVGDLKQRGMTILMATHEMGFARHAADQVCFLEDGVIREQGGARQVLGDPQHASTRRFLSRVLEHR